MVQTEEEDLGPTLNLEQRRRPDAIGSHKRDQALQ